ncbi:hypothetical protein STCU_09862 [Strigomonas culicis]|uniref:Uncharacterized protein n=1 Tax=Strigomonas culicis TaxID=28005 RepID=S9V6T4_9TRYP|nr:hypothetical protein STCU_09862 [Strigomonas culicis]|eukprot:EPY18600.1 hypothetical protein STCU_09862 [Strigomonas culicis]
MKDRAHTLGANKLYATTAMQARYPFLPKRVDGVLLAELSLDDDKKFQELLGKKAPADALLTRAVVLAKEQKAVETFRADENAAVRARNPFLAFNDVRLVPLRELALEDDKQVKVLRKRRNRHLGRVPVDFAAIEDVDGTLLARVNDLASKAVASDLKGRRHYLTREFRGTPVFMSAMSLADDEDITLLRMDVVDNPDTDDKMVERGKEKVQARGECLLSSYLGAERALALELQRLREEYPNCVRDVNPAVEHDDFYGALKSTYDDWMNLLSMDDDAIEAAEHEMWLRSIGLIADERCVLSALNHYCTAEAELRLANVQKKPPLFVSHVQSERDAAQYKHSMWRRRQARRRPQPLLMDYPDEEADETLEEDVGILSAAKTASALATNDAYYMFLQREKVVLAADRKTGAARCVNELLKLRLRQLTADTARQRLAREREENELLCRFPFLRRDVDGVPLSRVALDDNEDFMRLVEEREALLRPPADLRERYSFLPDSFDGVAVTELGLENDPEFMRLAAQREDVIGPLRRKLESVKQKEDEIKAKCAELVASHIAKEAALCAKLRFVDPRELPVPLGDLDLESNPKYTSLMARYEQAVGSADRAKRLRLEKNIADLVRGMATDEAIWQNTQLLESESLCDRYPFLPLEPATGIRLGDLGVTSDPTFRRLAYAVDEARKDPPNFGAIEAVENTLKEYVEHAAGDKRAEVQRRRQRYPRLPRRSNGILISDVPLPEAGELYSPTEDQICRHVHFQAARMKKNRIWRAEDNEAIRARNPFLESNDVRCLPLRDLHLPEDPTYRSYMKKWMQALSKDTVDRDTVRIYEDLLRECAEELAAGGIVKQGHMMDNLEKGFYPLPPVNGIVLRDLHDAIAADKSVADRLLTDGDVPRASPEDATLMTNMYGTYTDAEEDVAKEIEGLREDYPLSVRDVNPALRTDERFACLETERQQLLRKSLQGDMLESIEKEEKKRSVELMSDDAYLRAAAAACEDFAQKPLRKLSAEELTKRWKLRLKENHHRSRLVTFTDVPEAKAEKHRGSGKRTRDRKRRNTSWSNLEMAAVPDNVFSEIREDEHRTSLPGSSMVLSEAAAPEAAPADATSPVANKRRRTKSRRHSQSLVGVVPDNEASSTLLLPSSVHNSAAPTPPLATAASPPPQEEAEVAEEPSGDTDAAATPATGEKKKRRRVLKKRVKVRRTSLVSQLSINAIPDLMAGEVYERDVENLGAAPAAHAPRKPTARRRRSQSASAIGFGFAPLSADEPNQGREPEVEVHTKHRKRGTSRMASQTLEAVGEAPEITVGPLQAEVGDAPSMPVLSEPAPATPPPQQQQPEAREATGTPSKRPASATARPHKRRNRSANRSRSLISMSDVQLDAAGEVPDMDNMSLEARSAGDARARHRRPPSSLGPQPAAGESGPLPHKPPTAEGAAGHHPHRRHRKQVPLFDAREAEPPMEQQQAQPLDATKTPMARKVQNMLAESDAAAPKPPADPSAIELERIQRYITACKEAASDCMTRDVETAEIEADADLMALVYERHDLLQFAAGSLTPQGTPLQKGRVADIDKMLEEAIISISQEVPAASRVVAKKVDEVRSVRQHKHRLAQIPSLYNPRCVPMRWAHLTNEELDQDDGLRTLIDSGSATEEKINAYLRSWSLRKEAANEALYARYPFLPTLPQGLSLLEVGFTDDKAFQSYARDHYKVSPHLQQQMRQTVLELAAVKVAAQQGRKPTTYVDRVRSTVGGTRPEAEAPAEDPNEELAQAIKAARAKKASKFLDERSRHGFITQSRQDGTRLIKRMMERMKKDHTSDIPLSMEDVETLRFFFDGVDADHFGVLGRADYMDYIMLTVAEDYLLRRVEVEQLTFPGVAPDLLPKLVDFSDFSKFYKAVALQEVTRQDPNFDRKLGDVTPQRPLVKTSSVPRQPPPRMGSVDEGGSEAHRPSSFNVKPPPKAASKTSRAQNPNNNSNSNSNNNNSVSNRALPPNNWMNSAKK